MSRASNNVTWEPVAARRIAAASPPNPEPMTAALTIHFLHCAKRRCDVLVGVRREIIEERVNLSAAVVADFCHECVRHSVELRIRLRGAKLRDEARPHDRASLREPGPRPGRTLAAQI